MDEDADVDSTHVWIAGRQEGNVGGIGVLFSDKRVGALYGPVRDNTTDKVNQQSADTQALALALTIAVTMDYKKLTVHSSSNELKDIVTNLLAEWKARGWRKSDGSNASTDMKSLQDIDDCLENIPEIIWNWSTSEENNLNGAKLLSYAACRRLCDKDVIAGLGVKLVHELQQLDINSPDEERDLMSEIIAIEDSFIKGSLPMWKIHCKLNISEEHLERLKRKNPDIKVMSDVNNFGYLQCLRTFGKLENDGTMKVVVSNMYPLSAANANDLLNSPTLVVIAGNVIGRAFTSSEKDRTLDESKIGYNFFWTNDDRDTPEC